MTSFYLVHEAKMSQDYAKKTITVDLSQIEEADFFDDLSQININEIKNDKEYIKALEERLVHFYHLYRIKKKQTEGLLKMLEELRNLNKQ